MTVRLLWGFQTVRRRCRQRQAKGQTGVRPASHPLRPAPQMTGEARLLRTIVPSLHAHELARTSWTVVDSGLAWPRGTPLSEDGDGRACVTLLTVDDAREAIVGEGVSSPVGEPDLTSFIADPKAALWLSTSLLNMSRRCQNYTRG